MSIKAGNGTIGGQYFGQTYYAGSPKLINNHVRNFSDLMTVIDTKIFSSFRAFLDNLFLGDNGVLMAIKTFSEGIFAVDTYGKVGTFVRGFVESVGIADIFSKLISKAKFVESIILSELVDIFKLVIVFFQEAIHIVDNFASVVHKFFTKIFQETISLAESYTRKLDKILNFIESITISELYTGFRGVLQHFIDSIVASDSISFTHAFVRFYQDTVTMFDNVFKSIASGFVDTITLIDTKVLSVGRNFIDNLSLSENISKSVNIVLGSIVGLSDSITRRLNGMIINWKKTFEKIGDWTKRALNTESTEKVTVDEEDWTGIEMATDSYGGVSKNVESWTKRAFNTEENTKVAVDVKDWTKTDLNKEIMTKTEKESDTWEKESKDTDTYTKVLKGEDDWNKFKGINDNE